MHTQFARPQKDVILEIADDLYHDCRMNDQDSGHDDPVREQKYMLDAKAC